jgi:hypothetical protein
VDVLRTFPAAFAANMRNRFPLHGAASRQHRDGVGVTVQPAAAVKLSGQIDESPRAEGSGSCHCPSQVGCSEYGSSATIAMPHEKWPQQCGNTVTGARASARCNLGVSDDTVPWRHGSRCSGVTLEWPFGGPYCRTEGAASTP